MSSSTPPTHLFLHTQIPTELPVSIRFTTSPDDPRVTPDTAYYPKITHKQIRYLNAAGKKSSDQRCVGGIVVPLAEIHAYHVAHPLDVPRVFHYADGRETYLRRKDISSYIHETMRQGRWDFSKLPVP